MKLRLCVYNALWDCICASVNLQANPQHICIMYVCTVLETNELDSVLIWFYACAKQMFASVFTKVYKQIWCILIPLSRL